MQFDESLKGGEDYLFFCQAFLKNPKYKYLNKCLYNYNISNNQSVMNTNSINTFIDQLTATKKVEKLLKEKKLYEKYESCINERYFWCLSEFNNWYLGLRGKKTLMV